ncbi:MAG: DUF7336 domain-containing protein [Armatimonadota bacterium]
MSSVYILHHVHLLTEDREDVKLIGVYSSRDNAEAAVERLRNQPGFCKTPKLVNLDTDENTDGFQIVEYGLDEDHWQEGFATWSYAKGDWEED